MKNPQIKTFPLGRLLFIAFLIFSVIVQAKVVIGNTNPQPSSMMDITTTSQVLLIPIVVGPSNSAILKPFF